MLLMFAFLWSTQRIQFISPLQLLDIEVFRTQKSLNSVFIDSIFKEKNTPFNFRSCKISWIVESC